MIASGAVMMLSRIQPAAVIGVYVIARGAAMTYIARMPKRNHVRRLRDSVGLSQAKFAAAFGLELRTVQEWEQGRRQPRGAAATLLRVIEHDPEWVIAALQPKPRKRPSKRR